jgi:predicted DNA-binding transcriptional regulator AlpA
MSAQLLTAPVRNLIDIRAVAKRYGCDARTARRWADAGLIPFGCKIGGLRRWDAAEIDKHIADGCPPVRSPKGGRL